MESSVARNYSKHYYQRREHKSGEPEAVDMVVG